MHICLHVAIRGLSRVRCDCSKLMGLSKVSVKFFLCEMMEHYIHRMEEGGCGCLGCRWSVVSAWAAATKGMFTLNVHSPNLDPIQINHNQLPEVVSIRIAQLRFVTLEQKGVAFTLKSATYSERASLGYTLCSTCLLNPLYANDVYRRHKFVCAKRRMTCIHVIAMATDSSELSWTLL